MQARPWLDLVWPFNQIYHSMIRTMVFFCSLSEPLVFTSLLHHTYVLGLPHLSFCHKLWSPAVCSHITSIFNMSLEEPPHLPNRKYYLRRQTVEQINSPEWKHPNWPGLQGPDGSVRALLLQKKPDGQREQSLRDDLLANGLKRPSGHGAGTDEPSVQ